MKGGSITEIGAAACCVGASERRQRLQNQAQLENEESDTPSNCQICQHAVMQSHVNLSRNGLDSKLDVLSSDAAGFTWRETSTPASIGAVGIEY